MKERKAQQHPKVCTIFIIDIILSVVKLSMGDQGQSVHVFCKTTSLASHNHSVQSEGGPRCTFVVNVQRHVHK